ncbi:VOC family protein [Niveispirillum sp.]|uniref:VOC family protein n=1 Tax=Niveispirillum sp. TaxID=1917217 RepID=UPI001B62C665|nr:VOC family protein [Niveispirillum sp.]MBP7335705.1 VOC family protein [Niveispirillum sp.]
MSIIKVEDLAFVRFQVPDLAEMRKFLEDFGLNCAEREGRIYARGTDGAPFLHVSQKGESRFIGLGFRARSRADLDLLARHEGVPVQPADTPGGGYLIRLTDPDGHLVDVLAEQSFNPAEPLAPQAPFNSLGERRRLSVPVRIDPAPSHVRRLGHAMIMVGDYAMSSAWYRERLGLIPSDQVEVEPNVPIGAFMRMDKGDIPTDHHTLAMVASPGRPGFGHAAFEVDGFDDLMKGHSYLKERNREHAWGVGRHKLGSQIFDYWRDPWGNELEHWTDGDVYTAADPMGVGTIDDLLGTLWGPRHPALTGGH